MDHLFGFLKLIAILAILGYGTYFLAYKLKKQRFARQSPNRLIQVIDGVNIGVREEIMLLKVGTEYILLSASSGHMLALSQERIEAPEGRFEELLPAEKPALTIKHFVQQYRKGGEAK